MELQPVNSPIALHIDCQTEYLFAIPNNIVVSQFNANRVWHCIPKMTTNAIINTPFSMLT